MGGWIEENPLLAAGGVAALGVGALMLLGGKKKKKKKKEDKNSSIVKKCFADNFSKVTTSECSTYFIEACTPSSGC